MLIRSLRVAVLASLVLFALPALALAAAPTVTFSSFTELTNPQYSYELGSTVFYNPTAVGSFAVNVTANDSDGDFDHVDFPDFGAGWSGSANGDPLSWTYAFIGMPPASPASQAITGVDLALNTSAPATIMVLPDSTAPTGGTVTYATGAQAAAGVSVNLAAGTDAGSGTDVTKSQLQRATGTYASGTCTGLSGYAPIGGANPGSPYTDNSVSAGSCYRYRLSVTDNVGNTGYTIGAGTVGVDTIAPTGTINASPAGPVRTSLVIGGTSADATSGVQKVDVKYTGLVNGNVCLAPASPTSWSCTLNISGFPDGTYTLALEVTDNAGNRESTAITRTIVVDNTPPTSSFNSFTEHTNPQYQFAIGSTMYYNPAQAGSFGVTSDASDAVGVERIDFPALTTGWTPPGTSNTTAPYTITYTWTAGAVEPGTGITATAYDYAGGSATSTFAIVADSTVPTAGSISYTDGITTGASRVVTYGGSTDAIGVASRDIQRRSAPVVAGTCTGFGSWTTVSSTSPYTDSSIADGSCYQYRGVTTDQVGNASAYATSPNTVTVDRTAPTGTISATPAGPIHGAINGFTGMSSDSGTGVAFVNVRYSGPMSGNVCLLPASPQAWSCNWNTVGLTDGVYTITSEVTDNAGLRESPLGSITRTVVVDNGPPVSSFTSFTPVLNPGAQYISGSTIYVDGNQTGSFTVRVNSADAGSGMSGVSFPSLGTSWGPAGGTDSAVHNPYLLTYTFSPGAANAGSVTAVASDVAGNTTNVNFTVHSDSAGPVSGLSYTAGGTTLTSIDVATGATDSGSGLVSRQLQRATAPLTHGVCGTYSAFTNSGGVNPANPTTDSTLTTATCYEYRLIAIDHLGLTTTDTGGEVKVDSIAPTGTIGAAPVGAHGTTVITGTSDDVDSGVAQVELTYAGDTSGSVCVVTVTPTAWSCDFHTIGLVEGTYTLTLAVTDFAGHREAIPINRTIAVDNTLPVASLASITPVSGAAGQLISGNHVFYNGNTAGSFTVAVNAVDAGSGMNAVTFPTLGGSWSAGGIDSTPPSPYSHTYSWVSGSSSPGAINVSAGDLADNDTLVPLTIDNDADQPVGGLVTYADGFTNQASVSVSVLAAGDGTGSGIASSELQRADGTLTLGSCTSFSSFADLVADPTPTQFDANLIDGHCYRYRLVVTDKVGNVATFTSANTVEVDMTDIAVSSVVLTPLTGAAGLHVAGTTIFVNPLVASSFTAGATSTSTGSVDHVSFGGAGAEWTPLLGADVTSHVGSTYSQEYDHAIGAAAPGVVSVTAQNTHGRSSSTSFTVTDDSVAPAGATVSIVGGITNAATVPVTWSSGTDAGSGLGVTSIGRLQAPLAAGSCGANAPVVTLSTAPAAPLVDSPVADGCYTYQVTSTDNVGNAVMVTSAATAIVDRTPPVVSAPAPTRSIAGVSLAFTAPSDAATSVASSRLERATASFAAGRCGAFGAFAQLGAASPTSTVRDATITVSHCYQYRIVATDAAGNQAASAATTVAGSTVLGTPSADLLTGSARVDAMFGGDGNDVLKGGAGNDVLHGGNGNDQLDGGAGTDSVFGDAGNDTISARDKKKDTIDCGAGNDTAVVDKVDKVKNCEHVKRK